MCQEVVKNRKLCQLVLSTTFAFFLPCFAVFGHKMITKVCFGLRGGIVWEKEIQNSFYIFTLDLVAMWTFSKIFDIQKGEWSSTITPILTRVTLSSVSIALSPYYHKMMGQRLAQSLPTGNSINITQDQDGIGGKQYVCNFDFMKVWFYKTSSFSCENVLFSVKGKGCGKSKVIMGKTIQKSYH